MTPLVLLKIIQQTPKFDELATNCIFARIKGKFIKQIWT